MGHRRDALIARRVHLDFTQESLAHVIGVGVSTVAKWEAGRRIPAPGIRTPLAEALQVSLIDLDRLLGIEPPIELNRHEVPSWLNTYESLVQAAGSLAVVERSAVHGLLQTKAYAATVERYGPVALTDNQVIERVDLRLARQAVLYREVDPLGLTILLSESVLHHVVGDPGIMQEQLDHLAEVAQRPNVDLRLLPTDGREICSPTGFELLTRPGDYQPFMAVTASVGGPSYIEDPLQVDRWLATWRYLDATALPATETTRRLKMIRETYR
jgi:transcriptional regulator with XRE-family HTH domain